MTSTTIQKRRRQGLTRRQRKATRIREERREREETRTFYVGTFAFRDWPRMPSAQAFGEVTLYVGDEAIPISDVTFGEARGD